MLDRPTATLNRVWNSPVTGAILAIAAVVTIIVALGGCSSGGFQLPFFGRGGGTPTNGGAATADPFASLWWIAPIGVIAGVGMFAFLGMRKEGILTIVISIALTLLLHFLAANMTLILIASAIAAAFYFLGNGQQRLDTLMRARKLLAEGGEEARAGTALLRTALPWVDKRYRKQNDAEDEATATLQEAESLRPPIKPLTKKETP